MERWSGRVALVTGASSGIGAALCRLLAESGVTVIGAARRIEKIEELAASLKGAKGSLTGIKCDLSKDQDIYDMFTQIKEKFGGVDICVNNAALSIGKKFLATSQEEFRYLMNVNVFALVLCTKLSLQSMIDRGVDDGHIININSTSGYATSGSSSKLYSASKYAVRAITEGLRQEMRELKNHIRISSVAPGIVETEFAFTAFENQEIGKRLYSSVVALSAEDVADTILHVISAPPHVDINEVILRPTEQTH